MLVVAAGLCVKSPAELAARLARQWQRPQLRESRLFEAQAWPLRLPIGEPSPWQLLEDLTALRERIQQWRRVEVGRVEWQARAFRSTEGPVELPSAWVLGSPSEWIAACDRAEVQAEFARLESLLPQMDPRFHRLLVRQLGWLRAHSDADLLACGAFALQAEPGCAQGRPLRSLGIAGIDSKLLERCRGLVLALLDLRFDGAAGAQGLETFLGAAEAREHWLLVVPLASGLLPFERLRLRASELAERGLPGSRVLVVENERCAHALPALDDTVAVLGAGLDLAWLGSPVWRSKRIAYWGDIDTWGLQMLARARALQPGLDALLMDRACWDAYAADHAVEEPVPAEAACPDALQPNEQALYRHLLAQSKARLEQEFLPADFVRSAVCCWAAP